MKASVAGFNHNYVDLLKAIKAANACRGAIKRHYRKFDHQDEGHLARWSEWTATFVARFLEDADAALSDASLGEDTRIFEEIYLDQVIDAVPRPALAQYLYALAAMARLHEIDAGDEEVAAVRQHMAAIGEEGEPGGEPCELTDVKDVRVREIVEAARAAATRHQAPPEMPLPPQVAEQMRKLENTKIGRMAREISASLGPDALNDPAGLASVIGKVGGVMQAKMRSGELDHGELLREAMGMLGSLPSLFGAAGAGGAGGAEGMAEMFQGMMGAFGGQPAAAAAAAPTNGGGDTRARLAAKLAARKAATVTAEEGAGKKD